MLSQASSFFGSCPHAPSPLPPFANPGVSELSYGRAAPYTMCISTQELLIPVALAL